MRKQTPSQTVGPFYAIGLTRKPMNIMANESTEGQRIRIEGQVFDGDGAAIPDVMVEIWQANASGRYNHPDDKQEKPLDPSFTGWGRSGTDEKCFYSFETIKPGPVPGVDDAVQAPHINFVIFARGMLVLGAGRNAVRFSPPLVLTRAQADTAVKIFDEALTDVERSRR